MTLSQLVQFLRDRRLTLGLNQIEVANLLGVSNSTISNYERGSRKPEIEELRAWGRVLGYDLKIEWVRSGMSATPERLEIEQILNDLSPDELAVAIRALQTIHGGGPGVNAISAAVDFADKLKTP